MSLLRASLAGETEAWGEIVSRYKEAVFGLCLGFLRNRADAEDLTHDAFIRAYVNLRRYRLDKKFSTWLFTIASNLCRNRLRYRRYHPVAPPRFRSMGGMTRRRLWRRRIARRRFAAGSIVFRTTTALLLSSATIMICHIRRLLKFSPSRRGR